MLDYVVLLISTDASLIEPIQEVVVSVRDLHLEVCADLEEAEFCLQQDAVVLVLYHLTSSTSTTEATRLLRSVAATERPVSTIVLSEQHEAKQALTLLRQGAADYLSRPLNLSRLAYLADVLTVRARLAGVQPRAVPAVAATGASDSGPHFAVHSEEMKQVMEQVRRVIPQNTTILLTGETGTGKTRLARLIHEQSPRRHEPFLVVNCGALSTTLIESELFGHIKGAFTGADHDRAGKFAEAGRGTLLLDDVDALSPEIQVKLLRVVDERVYEPVGGNKTRPVQARLIAASNKALEQEVQTGRFRADLYYRLNVVGFHLPALRERSSLIVPLTHQLIAEFATRNGRAVPSIVVEALAALESYHWPGNIRELRNVIERAVALCPGPEICCADLPAAIGKTVPATAAAGQTLAEARPAAPSTLAETKEEAEITRILTALKKHSNNRLRAAQELGISRMTLYKKLHKYGLFPAT